MKCPNCGMEIDGPSFPQHHAFCVRREDGKVEKKIDKQVRKEPPFPFRMLEKRVEDDLKEALKRRKVVEVSTLRMLRAAIKNEAIAKRKDTLEDVDVIGVIKRQLKQRRESIEAYTLGNREDLANKEKEELDILAFYIPPELSEVVSAKEKATKPSNSDEREFSLIELTVLRFESNKDPRSDADLEPLRPIFNKKNQARNLRAIANDIIKMITEVEPSFPKLHLLKVWQGEALISLNRLKEAARVIREGLRTCYTKDVLCEVMGNVKIGEGSILGVGWYMQSLLLGSASWVPFLVTAYAARAAGLDELAWRCFNAVDVLDSGMKRMDSFETEIRGAVKKGDKFELIFALENFEEAMDSFLPQASDIPHDEGNRSIFIGLHMHDKIPTMYKRLISYKPFSQENR